MAVYRYEWHRAEGGGPWEKGGVHGYPEKDIATLSEIQPRFSKVWRYEFEVLDDVVIGWPAGNPPSYGLYYMCIWIEKDDP